MQHPKNIDPSLAVFVALTLALSACKPPENTAAHGHSHGHGHSHSSHGHSGHDDEDEEDQHPTFPVTVWTNGFEVFAEHEAIEAGEAVEFVTHITRLDDGQPRSDGSIKFVMTDANGASFEHVQSKPTQPGVYLPKISFAKAGEWRVAVRIPRDGETVEVSLGQVTVYPDHDAAHDAKSPEEVDGVGFLKEQQWNHPTLVRPVGRRDLARGISVAGEVHLAADRRGAVTTPISGRLLAPVKGRRPQLGETLAVGQIIGRVRPVFSEISSRLVEARAAVERAAIELADTRETFARIELLTKQEAKSRRELQAAEKQLRLAESAHENARALELAYASANAGLLGGGSNGVVAVDLAAPIQGIVSELSPIATGEFVPEGTVIARTLDLREVRIHAFVPESLAAQVTAIRGATVSRVGRPDETLEILGDESGRLVSIASEVDHETRSVAVHIATPNDAGQFRLGQRLTVNLQLGLERDAIAIPNSALIEEEGLTTVYVQVAGETFEKRIVRVGVRDGDWTQITSGLNIGEMIVVKNAYAIRLAAVAGGEVPHGHHH